MPRLHLNYIHPWLRLRLSPREQISPSLNTSFSLSLLHNSSLFKTDSCLNSQLHCTACLCLSFDAIECVDKTEGKQFSKEWKMEMGYNRGVVTEKEMGGGGGGGGKAVGMPLRVLVMLLTLAAAVVLGLDEQRKAVGVPFGSITIYVPATAKSSDSSAFLYFVVVNSIACAFTALSMTLSLAGKVVKASRLALLTVLGDTIMVALLFSGNGAAIAIGLMGKKGNSHLQWKEVCSVFGKFCNIGIVAMVLSLLGSAVYLSLVCITIFHLHKR